MFIWLLTDNQRCVTDPDDPNRGCLRPGGDDTSEAKYRDCDEIKKGGDRKVYHDYVQKTVYIGPSQMSVQVLCEMRKNTGGWTVCDKMYYNLQLLQTVAVACVLKAVMPRFCLYVYQHEVC